MEGTDWLRAQLAGFACGECGRGYVASSINVLAQRDDLFFVDLSCRGCGAEAVAIVTIHVDDEAGVRIDAGELSRGDDMIEQAPPVRPDDVLAMHEFLREFDGDFRSLFGSADPSDPAPGT